MLKILHSILNGCGVKKDNTTSHYFSKHFQKNVKSLIYLRIYRNLVVLSKKILDGTKVMSIMWNYSVAIQSLLFIQGYLFKLTHILPKTIQFHTPLLQNIATWRNLRLHKKTILKIVSCYKTNPHEKYSFTDIIRNCIH